MQYRRTKNPGGTYFFTVNLFDRKKKLLIEHINSLRTAFKKVKLMHPFSIDAIVILPDHLHMIMTLPKNDFDYSLRWRLIKMYFSKSIESSEEISASRLKRRERSIWQRRFWEHLIRDDHDLKRHIDYIHYNPVKHGYVTNPSDWLYSSVHQYIQEGRLSFDWAKNINENMEVFAD